MASRVVESKRIEEFLSLSWVSASTLPVRKAGRKKFVRVACAVSKKDKPHQRLVLVS